MNLYWLSNKKEIELLSQTLVRDYYNGKTQKKLIISQTTLMWCSVILDLTTSGHRDHNDRSAQNLHISVRPVTTNGYSHSVKEPQDSCTPKSHPHQLIVSQVRSPHIFELASEDCITI